MRESELVLPWAGRGHGDLDAPHADADQGAELQQFQSDRAAGGVGALAPQESNDIKGLFQTSITETYAISMTYVTSAPTPTKTPQVCMLPLNHASNHPSQTHVKLHITDSRRNKTAKALVDRTRSNSSRAETPTVSPENGNQRRPTCLEWSTPEMGC